MCAALTVWWKLRGRFALADSAYVRALDAAGEEPSPLRARVLWARGYLLSYSGRFEEAVASELAALELAQQLEEKSTAARALDVLGTMQIFAEPAGGREGARTGAGAGARAAAMSGASSTPLRSSATGC